MLKLTSKVVTCIRNLCKLIPKSAANMQFTQVYLCSIHDQLIAYGGNPAIALYSYWLPLQANISTVALNAHSLLTNLKPVKQDIDIKILDGKLSWQHGTTTTNLNLIVPSTYIHPTSSYQGQSSIVDADQLIRVAQSVILNSDTGKLYIHVHDNTLKFIFADATCIAISWPIAFTADNRMVICNHEAIANVMSILSADSISIHSTATHLILRQDIFVAEISVMSVPLNRQQGGWYMQYTNSAANMHTVTIHTSTFLSILKDLNSISNSKTLDIVTLRCVHTELIAECYNPNTGRKRATLSVDGTMHRAVKLNLTLLTEIVSRITTKTFTLLYNPDNTSYPIILQSDCTYVLAPIMHV